MQNHLWLHSMSEASADHNTHCHKEKDRESEKKRAKKKYVPFDYLMTWVVD